MPVPDYESLMLPFLKLTSDGAEHNLAEANEKIARDFNLSKAEVEELLPSGRQRVLYSRIHWARTYLKNALLIESTGRGTFRITKRGKDVLAHNPTRIDDKFLSQFPEWQDFQKKSPKPESKIGIEEKQIMIQTPDELIESGYQRHREALASELLQRVKNSSSEFFEQLVVDLLVAMGYGGSRKDAGQAVGKSHDGGIDGIIKEDKLGLDAVYIPAKKWDGPVGRKEVQSFVGSLEPFRASKGVFIITSRFAQPAVEYVKNIGKKVVLIDGEQLAQLMIEHNVGVTEVATYRVMRADLDFFGEE